MLKQEWSLEQAEVLYIYSDMPACTPTTYSLFLPCFLLCSRCYTYTAISTTALEEEAGLEEAAVLQS